MRVRRSCSAWERVRAFKHGLRFLSSCFVVGGVMGQDISGWASASGSVLRWCHEDTKSWIRCLMRARSFLLVVG
jgi:hypothetical protein